MTVGHSTSGCKTLQPVHEIILQALCILADTRGADVTLTGDLNRISTVMRCILAMNGFMTAATNRLVRPP